MTGEDGDGSYQRLIANIYGVNKTKIVFNQKYAEFNTKILPDEIVIQKVLRYVRSGDYEYSIGRSGFRRNFGSVWENIPSRLGFYQTYLNTFGTEIKGYGHSLHCVAKSCYSSGDASDSICPKGWGMAGEDGDGSYLKLFRRTYAISEFGDMKITITNLNLHTIKSSLLLRDFFSGVLNGILGNGKTYYLGNSNLLGYYTNFVNELNAYSMLLAYNPMMKFFQPNDKGFGSSVRWGAKSCYSSGDASGSICPKGWGIARRNGDGSYLKMLKTVYGLYSVEKTIVKNFDEYDKYVQLSEMFRQDMMSLLFSGYYYWQDGKLRQRTAEGIIKGVRVGTSNRTTINFDFTGDIVYFDYAGIKGSGHTVR